MRTTLTTLLLSVILLVGCADGPSSLTSPEAQINQQSNSPNWVNLPTDLDQGLGVETEYSAEKFINGRRGGHIKLKVKIKRPGHQFGDYEVKAKVKIAKHSFPDDENILFTITMDPNNAYLNISPSPSTLYKHIKVDWEIKGIDVSGITPENFDFLYVGNNSEMLETAKLHLTVDYNKHKIKVKKAEIIAPTDQTPDGARYGFVH